MIHVKANSEYSNMVDVICITNVYYFSSKGNKVHDELIVNKKYRVRKVLPQSNSNRDKFYEINNKYYRIEMFKTIDEIRDEKIDSICG